MLRKISLISLVLVLSLVFAVPAFAQPSFGPAIYADGEVFSTQGLATLPPPNDDKNLQSFDKLFNFTNGVEGQLAVAEAAPGNPAFNGGRWYAHTITWEEGAEKALLTSYADIMAHADDLIITPGDHNDPGTFFLCPLLPVK